MRRNALPSVTPKPRSSGSATTVAIRAASEPAETWSLFGLINSCQFFWITSSPFQRRGLLAPSAPHPPCEENFGGNTRGAKARATETLHATTLTRPAAVMRNRRHIADRSDGEPGRLQRTKRRFAPRSRPGHLDFESAHAVLLCLLGGVFSSDLRGIGRRFARALETHGPGRRPGNRIALRIGDGDHGIVERGRDMRDARRDVLAFAPTDACGFLTHPQSFRARAPQSAQSSSC